MLCAMAYRCMQAEAGRLFVAGAVQQVCRVAQKTQGEGKSCGEQATGCQHGQVRGQPCWCNACKLRTCSRKRCDSRNFREAMFFRIFGLRRTMCASWQPGRDATVHMQGSTASCGACDACTSTVSCRRGRHGAIAVASQRAHAHDAPWQHGCGRPAVAQHSDACSHRRHQLRYVGSAQSAAAAAEPGAEALLHCVAWRCNTRAILLAHAIWHTHHHGLCLHIAAAMRCSPCRRMYGAL